MNRQNRHRHHVVCAAISGLLLASAARSEAAGPAKPAEPPAATLRAELEQLKRQLAAQTRLLDALSREVAAQRAQLRPNADADKKAETVETDKTTETTETTVAARASWALEVNTAAAATDATTATPAVTPEVLATSRGSGNLLADPASADSRATSPPPLGNAPAAAIAAATTTQPQASSSPGPAAPRVGRAPASRGRPPEIAPLFEQPGVLTPKGKFILEPGLQFGYSSSNRVALVGYTVIPALLIGLVDVREVKRNTVTALLSARTGVGKRMELELKVPYVHRADSTVSREIFTGTAVEKVFDTSGRHLGDVEVGLRYQLNNGGVDSPYYIGGLRIKSRTGRDPFSVVTDCARRCVGPNASGTGLPLTLPTGSGFYAAQPSMTWLFPSDPAVFFGSVSYLRNIKRRHVSRTVLGGEKEYLGEVAPGDILGFNFGMGLGLNEKASFSLGYDHSSIGRTRQNGVTVPGSVRTQLGTLVLGYSYRLSDRRSVNVSVGAGLTRDTPDVSLTVRLPVSF